MKKLIALFASVSIAASFAACTKDSESSSPAQEPVGTVDITPDKPITTSVRTENTPKSTTSNNSNKFGSSKTEANSQSGIVDIVEVLVPFNQDGEAVLKGSNGKTYLVNEEGYSIAEFEKGLGGDDYDGVDPYENGYILGLNFLSDTEKSFGYEQNFWIYTIYDKNRNVIFNENDNIITPISKSGYMMTFEVVEQLSGTTEKYKIVDMNGKTVCELGEGWFKDAGYISDDIFFYEQNGKGIVLIDAAANKLLETGVSGGVSSDSRHVYTDVHGDSELNDWIKIGNTYFNKNLSGQNISFDKSNYIGSKMEEVPLTDNRFWHENTIYDFEGNPLKEITDGGVANIYYYDGVYYVESENNFIYTLDADFKYISEPVKKESVHLIGVTSMGVVIRENYEISIIDEKLNKKEMNLVGLYEGDYVYYYASADSSKITAYNPINGRTIENIIIDAKSNTNISVASNNNSNSNSKPEPDAVNLCADSSNWTSWSSEENGCAANLKILSNGAALEVTKADAGFYEGYELSNYLYFNQLGYNNIALEKGATYRWEFDYESSEDILFNFAVQQNYEPYSWYASYNDGISDVLSDVGNHYSMQFTMPVNDSNVSIVFNCNYPDAATPYTFTVKNLTLVRVS